MTYWVARRCHCVIYMAFRRWVAKCVSAQQSPNQLRFCMGEAMMALKSTFRVSLPMWRTDFRLQYMQSSSWVTSHCRAVRVALHSTKKVGKMCWARSPRVHQYLTYGHSGDQSWAWAGAQYTMFAFRQSCIMVFSNTFEKHQTKLFKYSVLFSWDRERSILKF